MYQNSDNGSLENIKFVEIPLHKLGCKTRRILSDRLNQKKILRSDMGFERDWRGIATLAGVKNFCNTNNDDPISRVLEMWCEQKPQTANFACLIRFLGKIDRWDVGDDIYNMMVEDAKTYNFLQREESQDSATDLTNSCDNKDEHYEEENNIFSVDNQNTDNNSQENVGIISNDSGNSDGSSVEDGEGSECSDNANNGSNDVGFHKLRIESIETTGSELLQTNHSVWQPSTNPFLEPAQMSHMPPMSHMAQMSHMSQMAGNAQYNNELMLNIDDHVLTNDDIMRIHNHEALEQYDAFVLYVESEATERYAEEIQRKVGNERKLCFRDDLIPGSLFPHEKCMRLIEQRCNHVLVLLTRDFNSSPEEAFFMKYAQMLQIKGNHRLIIPIVYDNITSSEIPFSLKMYSCTKYIPNSTRLWEKLSFSISDYKKRLLNSPVPLQQILFSNRRCIMGPRNPFLPNHNMMPLPPPISQPKAIELPSTSSSRAISPFEISEPNTSSNTKKKKIRSLNFIKYRAK